MGDASWKAWERRVAKLLGGQRRGPSVGGDEGGKCDVVHPVLDTECKLLTTPHYGDVERACTQAEEDGNGGIPVAVIRRKGDPWERAVVAVHLDVFRDKVLPCLETVMDKT